MESTIINPSTQYYRDNEEKRLEKNAKQRIRYATNAEYKAYHSAKNKKWREDNRDKMNAYQRKHRDKYPKRSREMNTAQARVSRGLPTPSRSQPLVCELCNSPNDSGRQLCLDHCHDSGAFRGWLCNRCNTGLGLIGDTVKSLERALAYLKAVKEK